MSVNIDTITHAYPVYGSSVGTAMGLIRSGQSNNNPPTDHTDTASFHVSPATLLSSINPHSLCMIVKDTTVTNDMLTPHHLRFRQYSGLAKNKTYEARVEQCKQDMQVIEFMGSSAAREIGSNRNTTNMFNVHARQVCLMISGKTNCYNWWRKDMKDGEKLILMLKPVNHDTKYTDALGNYVASDHVEVAKNKISSLVLELIFISTHRTELVEGSYAACRSLIDAHETEFTKLTTKTWEEEQKLPTFGKQPPRNSLHWIEWCRNGERKINKGEVTVIGTLSERTHKKVIDKSLEGNIITKDMERDMELLHINLKIK